MHTGVKTAELQKLALEYCLIEVPNKIILDNNISKEMWQDWLINHFLYDPTEPNFILLHFIGKEATFRINGEFSHEKL